MKIREVFISKCDIYFLHEALVSLDEEEQRTDPGSDKYKRLRHMLHILNALMHQEDSESGGFVLRRCSEENL